MHTLFNFNKEIFFAEAGAFIASALLGYVLSLITSNSSFISTAVLIGGIIGSSAVWMMVRLYDNNKPQHGEKQPHYGMKELFNDIIYFTPGAFIAALVLYYPTLFFLSKQLLVEGQSVFMSVLIAQAAAFALTLIAINGWRFVVKWIFKKTL